MFTTSFNVVGVVACLVGTYSVVDAGKTSGRRSIASVDWVPQRWVGTLGQQSKKLKSADRVRRGHSEKGVHAQTVAVQYVSVFSYEDTTCTTPQLQIVFGTGICGP
jgi:hypothetical protein